MPFIPRYFTYSSMTFSPLFSICSFYSGNWYQQNKYILDRKISPGLVLNLYKQKARICEMNKEHCDH
ncbi:hypothetical protein [Wolbachia endosymbiont of Frankliniella intonsa]|uniref:hypothetical protein n=1 Tax=Wolbachia endosymbiont of Frankliniella intonsa TaxID=2902422 RepID=UPI00244EDC71|nr:hypothetical protein [Wolbachia endosymbiont of Frankliniella intonsa]WGJ62629.1 hypothetical protein M3L71_03400 [Wolbachia endosymbiont of Frankliniella intonsa]